MMLECSTCPVRGRRCDGCVVTAMAAIPVPEAPAGLALDPAERRAVRAFADAGLIGRGYAGSLLAQGQPGDWWGRVSS